MKFIYLASPLSHPKKEKRQERYEAVLKYVADTVLDENYFIYSPIAYHYPIAQIEKLPHGFEFWRKRDFLIIEKSDELWVLTLDEWENSIGIQAEIEYANKINIPAKLVTMKDNNETRT